MEEEDESGGIGVDVGMEIVEGESFVGESALVRVLRLDEEGVAVIVRSFEHLGDVVIALIKRDGGEELLVIEEGLRLHYFLINYNKLTRMFGIKSAKRCKAVFWKF